MKITENDVKKQVIAYLKMKNILYIRNNTAAVQVYDEKLIKAGKRPRMMMTGTPGSPDLILALPGGVTLWVELKRPASEQGGKKFPAGKQSEKQKAFEIKLEKLGHFYAVIDSVEMLMSVLAYCEHFYIKGLEKHI